MPLLIRWPRDAALFCLRRRHYNWEDNSNASGQNDLRNSIGHRAPHAQITCGRQPVCQIWSQMVEILATFWAGAVRLAASSSARSRGALQPRMIWGHIKNSEKARSAGVL